MRNLRISHVFSSSHIFVNGLHTLLVELSTDWRKSPTTMHRADVCCCLADCVPPPLLLYKTVLTFKRGTLKLCDNPSLGQSQSSSFHRLYDVIEIKWLSSRNSIGKYGGCKEIYIGEAHKNYIREMKTLKKRSKRLWSVKTTPKVRIGQKWHQFQMWKSASQYSTSTTNFVVTKVWISISACKVLLLSRLSTNFLAINV